MKILQNKSNKIRNSIIVLSVILIVALLGISYMYIKKVGVFSATHTPQQTQNSKNDTTSPPTPSKQTVAITITASNVAGNNLSIRTLINKVSNMGTCTLTMTAEGQSTIVKTADVQALPSGATCKGFDIPLSELSSSNTWNAEIEYVNAEASGKATKVINL